MIALVLPYLLGACATDNVVVTPVGLAPVNKALLITPKRPLCNLPDQDSYSPAQLQSRGDCWEEGYKNIEARHAGLVRATLAREMALARVIKSK